MSDDETNYTYYGTALEPIEEDDVSQRKPIRMEDQVALDKQGRRRFHGAFTGGFSAGFYNTVGSEEGWTPKTFQSSRSEKAAGMREQRPQDFMDDEDQEIFGIAPKVLRARQEYGRSSDGPSEVRGNVIEASLAKMLRPVKERVGEKLMKRMGWRPGQRVGPRMSKEERREQRKQYRTEGQKVYGCALGPIEVTLDSDTDTDSLSGDMLAPEDLPSCLVLPKTNTFGMGYSGLDRRPVLSGHINLFEPPPMNAGTGKVAGIRGQAFGVGAFEKEDEDIYGQDDMSRYDFSLESSTERRNKRRWEQSNRKAPESQEDCLEGFKRATKPLATAKLFPPPKLPKSFVPKRGVKKSRFSEPVVAASNEHVKRGLGRHDMTAEERSILIGETGERLSQPIQQGPITDLHKTATADLGNEPVTDLHNATAVEQAVIEVEPADLKSGMINPFIHDQDKQLRYRKFLTLLEQGRKDDLRRIQPSTMTEWERGRESREFEQASKLFMSGPVSDRFVSSATLLGNEEVPKMDAPQVEASVNAAKMKLFGKLTRHVEPWHPCSLLCKRFNVPEPNSEMSEPKKKRPGFSVFDFLSAAPQNVIAQVDRSSVSQGDPGDEVTKSNSNKDVPLSSETPLSDSKQQALAKDTVSVSTTQPDVQIQEIIEVADDKVDLYKAIFLSSSEGESDSEPVTSQSEPMTSLSQPVTSLPQPSKPKEPERRPRSPPRGVFATLDLLKTTPATNLPPPKAVSPPVELPPDAYGPAMPTTSLPDIAEEVIEKPSPLEFVPSNAHWVEKTRKEKRSHSKHKKHKKEKKKKKAKRKKRERSPSSSSSSSD